MEHYSKRQSSRGPAELILSAANRYGPVAESLIAALDRKDLGRLRASCRNGRDLVSSQLTQLELLYCDGHKLAAARATGDDGASASPPLPREGDLHAVEAAQSSHWPALLAAFPACTDLTIHLGPLDDGPSNAAAERLARVADLGEVLLGPFAAATPSETAARVTRLRLHSATYNSVLALPVSLPRLISCAFPALVHLQLDRYWADLSAPDAFYSALAEHLPRLQTLQLCFHARQGDISREATAGAVALCSLRQLRVLRLWGYEDINLRDMLRLGLPDTLEHFELSGRGIPYFMLSAAVKAAATGNAATGMAATAAASTRGGSEGEAGVGSVGGSNGVADGGGGQQARRQWDVALLWGPIASHAGAVAVAELSVRKLSFRNAIFETSQSPLLQRFRQVEIERLRLKGDGEVMQLGDVLQRLGYPEVLRVVNVRRRGSLAGLGSLVAAGGLLAARVRRLKFRACAGLTPAGLVATLAALPLCEEVVVRSCPRICTERQYRSLVQQLLEAAARGPGALRGRRVRIELNGFLPPWDRRPGDDVSEVEEEVEEEDGMSLIPPKLTAAMVVARVVRRVVAARITEELNGELALGGLGVRLNVVLVARSAR